MSPSASRPCRRPGLWSFSRAVADRGAAFGLDPPPPGAEPATPRRFYCSRRASDPAEEREPLTPMEARGLLTVNGASGDYGSLPGGEQEGPPGSGRRRSHAFAGQPCGVERGTGECLCLSPCLNVCLYTSLLMTLCPCFSLVGGKSQWFDSKSPPL